MARQHKTPFWVARLYINYDQEYTFIRTSESSVLSFRLKKQKVKKVLDQINSVFIKYLYGSLHYHKTLEVPNFDISHPLNLQKISKFLGHIQNFKFPALPAPMICAQAKREFHEIL